MKQEEEPPKIAEIETIRNFAIEISPEGKTVIIENPRSPQEILEQGTEQITRLETIDIRKIVRDENTIIDKNHAKKMAKSLLQDGQQNTILVRARLNEHHKIVYDMADGFHRYGGACETKGEIKTLRAVVKYNYNDQWLNDQRLLAVNSVREIQFARKIIWMTNSFKESKWFKEKKLSIAQIAGLTFQDRSGKKFKLSSSEAEEAKE